MTQCVQTEVVLLMMELLTGDEYRSVEAAKRLIASSENVDPELLAKIISDGSYKPWSKAMSAYVLGFLTLDPDSHPVMVLRESLANRSLSVPLRDHAAEALGNLNDENAAELLSQRLFDKDEAQSVRKSCLYALTQLSSPFATSTLREFALSRPRGAIRKELGSLALAS